MSQSWEHKIDCKPDFSFLNVKIPSGETLKVEASAMATMSPNLKMKTKLGGGFSRMLTGESLFINEYTAEGADGEIGIAPACAGDLDHIHLDGQTIFLQNSAFLASTMGVTTETKWQGFKKGFFSGESFFLIKCSGEGDLWFNTYGAMIPIDVQGEYIIDTGYIVGFTEGLEYDVTMLGGYKSFFFSGEGLVCRFKGNGKVWIQSRKVQPLTSWLQPFRRVQKSNNN